MNVRVGVTILCCLLPAIGCRSDPSIELLESELRWMDDQLYVLDEQLEQKCAALESCRRYSAALESERGELGSGSSRAAGSGRSPRGSSDTGAFGGDDNDRIDLSPPTIDEGTETTTPNIDIEIPEEKNSGPPRLDMDDPLNGLPLPRDLNPDKSSGNVHRDHVEMQVAQIVLNSRLTGGYDFDGKPGDEGLLVVIEPRNSAGEYVPLPAPVAVEVHDVSRSGAASRIARWDFDVAETTKKMRTTLLGRGIHLELPWPIEPPSHSKLRIVAKYAGVANRELTVDRYVRVDLPETSEGHFASQVGRTPRPAKGRRTAGPEDSFVTIPLAPIENDGHDASNRESGAWTKRGQRNLATAKDPAPDRPTWSPYR